jgi:hypothetical protein
MNLRQPNLPSSGGRHEREEATVPVFPEIPVFAEPVTSPELPLVPLNVVPLNADSAAPADTPDARVDAPYLPVRTSAEAGERWRTIQGGFVDDPRRSVAEAHELVGELVQQIVDSFTNERAGLEKQWQSGESVSTEDLRVCLQRYRAFFTRLLPVVQNGG